MEKKYLVFLLSIFLVFSSQTKDFVSLYEFSEKYSLTIKVNLDFGYFEISSKVKKIKIFLNMPYIVYNNKVKYMDEGVVIKKDGEILLPLSYKNEIERILKEIPAPSSTNVQTNLIVKSSVSSSLISSKVEPVKIKEGFKPLNCVIIDPGHGGKDPGGLGVGGLEEKSLALNVSKRIASHLSKNKDIKIFLTRKDDRYISLKERMDFVRNIINKGYNPLFISIHGNISLNPSVYGIEIYTLSDKATDEEATAVEMKENINFDIEDVKDTEELFEILKDLIFDGLMIQSEALGDMLAKNISLKETIIRGRKKANFYVLKYNFVPSALLEIGYMSNVKEARLLLNKDYQNRLSLSIAEGLKDFIMYYNKTRGFSK
ncbi:MAG: N-acetylmuramoyl-L-alanine amidase family protein [Brevinematia bacterium]